MAMTKVEGKLVTLSFSTNLVTPAWLEVVCLEDGGMDGTTDVTSRNTKCGVFKAPGNVSWVINASGIMNATPEATQMSNDELITLLQDGTQVLWKTTHQTGDTLIYREGQGFLSAFSETYPATDLVGLDITVEVDGDIEIAA